MSSHSGATSVTREKGSYCSCIRGFPYIVKIQGTLYSSGVVSTRHGMFGQDDSVSTNTTPNSGRSTCRWVSDRSLDNLSYRTSLPYPGNLRKRTLKFVIYDSPTPLSHPQFRLLTTLCLSTGTPYYPFTSRFPHF